MQKQSITVHYLSNNQIPENTKGLRIISLKSLLPLQSVHYKGNCPCAATQIYIQQKICPHTELLVVVSGLSDAPCLGASWPFPQVLELGSDQHGLTFGFIHALGTIYFSIHTLQLGANKEQNNSFI